MVVRKVSQEQMLKEVKQHLLSLKRKRHTKKKSRTLRNLMGSYSNYICSGHMVICTRRKNPINCEKCGKEMLKI